MGAIIPFEPVHLPVTPRTETLKVLKSSEFFLELEFEGSPETSILRIPNSTRLLIVFSKDSIFVNESIVIEKLTN